MSAFIQHVCILCICLNLCLCDYEAQLNLAGVFWQFLNECQVCCKEDKRGGAQCASAWGSTVTDGDGLTYRVLLRSGGFSWSWRCQTGVCFKNTTERKGWNQPQIPFFCFLSGGGVCTNRRKLSEYAVLFTTLVLRQQNHCVKSFCETRLPGVSSFVTSHQFNTTLLGPLKTLHGLYGA